MYRSCESKPLVHQCFELNADICITPIVEHGDAIVSCIKSEIYSGGSCKEDKCECEKYDEECPKSCKFRISQVLCVEIPISFGVEVDVEKGSVNCSNPYFGPCSCTCSSKSEEICQDKTYSFLCPSGNEISNELNEKKYYDIEGDGLSHLV